MSLPLRLSKKLKENKLRQTVEKFRNELKNWKAVLKKIKELELLREQEIDEIKNETKKKRAKYVRWSNKRYFRKVRCRFNDIRTKM